jgi:hypothetical protein
MDKWFPPDALGRGDVALCVVGFLLCAACLVHAAFRGGK